MRIILFSENDDLSLGLLEIRRVILLLRSENRLQCYG